MGGFLMHRIQILLADNDKDFLNTRAEFLQNAGFRVLTASSPQEAEHILETARIHVAVLDIRLTNDGDERDTSGLTLAKKDDFRTVPKIILTGYPSYQYVREVLGPAVEGLPPAIDFLAKSEGAEAMIAAVKKAVDRHLAINWELQLKWGEFLSVEQLVRLIMPQLDQVNWLAYAAELEDLFRKLFPNCTQLTVDQILRQTPGRLLLAVFGFYEDGREAQFIVSCGLAAVVIDEDERFRTAVPEQAMVKMRRVDCVQSARFAVLAYSFLGGDLEDTVQLDALLIQETISEVAVVVDKVYEEQLRLWYDRGRFKNTAVSLSHYCRNRFSLNTEVSLKLLTQKIQDLSVKCVSSNVVNLQTAGSHLLFQLGAEMQSHLPHPVNWMQQTDFLTDDNLIWGLIHGAVHVETILGNSSGDAWLIDFSQVAPAPLLIDFVSLETAVKTHLLSGLTIDERYQLETELIEQVIVDSPAPVHSLSTTLEAGKWFIYQIRQKAVQLTNCDEKSYQQALFFEALAFLNQYKPALRYKRRTLLPFVHALLSASLLANAMKTREKTAVPKEAINGLWLDDVEKQVWVEGKLIKITPQDFQILDYLRRNAGKLCERRAIIEEGLGETYDKFGMDESRLNSAMSRLRHKIEPTPDAPKYLLTERGRGYRLQMK
jgi:DNA-binding response OmpR family regulator